jgi:DNA-directed RNA polymerase subunit H (RpoH/RPB5)
MDIKKILKHSVELLSTRGEDVTKYEKELMDLDMNRFYNEMIALSTKHITVFYAFSKDSFKELWATIRVMDLEQMEKLYGTKKFIMVLQEYPPSITLQAIQNKDAQMLPKEGFLQIFLMKELMYNPMKHELVPKHKKISEEEVKKLMEDMNLKSKAQLPFIQRQDIIARWLGLQSGEIVRITRYTETSGKYYFYRCCV